MVLQQAPVLTLDDRAESVFDLTPKELERYSRQSCFLILARKHSANSSLQQF